MIPLSLRGFVAALALVAISARAAETYPIVEVGTGYLLGASADGKWIIPDHAAAVVKAGDSYRVFSLTTELDKTRVEKIAAEQDVCPEVHVVSLEPKPEKGEIATTAPWNLIPHPVHVADPTQEIYVAAVREFLKTKSMRKPIVKIDKILRVDLDGDGEDEVLIGATNYFRDGEGMSSSTKPGSYSCVLLRRVVAGKVQTKLIAGEFYPTAKTFNAPNEYEISAVLDLNGDGRMEIVVRSSYYEGGETSVFQVTPAKIERVLSVECGA